MSKGGVQAPKAPPLAMLLRVRLEAAKNINNYKECDKLTEQMSVVKADRRRLQLELNTLN